MRSLIILSVILLSISVVYAQNFDFTIKPKHQDTVFREPVEYLITIQNKANETLEYTISVAAVQEWLNYQKTITLEPDSKGNLTLTVFPTNDIGDFNFSVHVYPYRNFSLRHTKPFTIFVSHPEGVLLKDDIVIRQWDDGRISVNLPVKTTERKDITVIADVLSETEDTKSTIITSEVDGSKRLFEYLNIQDLNAGDYTLKVWIDGTDNILYKNFTISPFSNVEVGKTSEPDFFAEKITVKVENLGNIVENDYSVFVDVPKGTTIVFLTPPLSSEDKGNVIKYEFKVAELKPGQSVEITYRFEYWHWILIGVGVVVVVIVIILWYLNIQRKPKITKSVDKTKEGFTITLDIRGSMFKHLKNVVIRDWVSPLAKVQQKFETLKPVVKSSSAGTELIWKIGDLHKGEERVIHYVIKPSLVGSLKMPKAYIRFSEKGEEQKKIFSNDIVINLK